MLSSSWRCVCVCALWQQGLWFLCCWWWWCRELVQIWTHCCRGFGKWQHHIGVQKTRCKQGYAWQEFLLLHLLPQELVLVSITLEGTSIMHLQVSNKKSSQTLCHLIYFIGAAATDTHPTATLIMLWLQSFFSLYLQIVIVENSLQFCRCVIFSNRSRSCWICCTHFILGQKVCWFLCFMALWIGTFLGKDQEQFGKMLIYYLGATITGTPVSAQWCPIPWCLNLWFSFSKFAPQMRRWMSWNHLLHCLGPSGWVQRWGSLYCIS